MSARYQNLELELSRCFCGQCEVRILDSPLGRARSSLRLQQGALQEMRSKIDRFDELVLESERGRRLKALEFARSIGRQLFALVATGEVGASLNESLRLLERDREHHDLGLRLRFSFGKGKNYDPNLATLPWELICDPRTGERFLGAEPMTQVTRHLEISRKSKPLAAPAPLRILAILASPKDQPRVQKDRQEALLRRATASSSGALEVEVLKQPSLSSLIDRLDLREIDGRPFHIIHFLGHGAITPDGEGSLYFEDDDLSAQIVRGELLANLLARFRDLRLVILASCSGAKLPRHVGQNPFTGCASALIAANLPAVLAMQFSITQRAADWFMEAFYAELARRSSLELAVARGRSKILAEDIDSLEWATPVLFLRSPDGAIFLSETLAVVSDQTHQVKSPRLEVDQTIRSASTDESVRVVGITGQGKRAGGASTRQHVEDVRARKDLTIVGYDGRSDSN